MNLNLEQIGPRCGMEKIVGLFASGVGTAIVDFRLAGGGTFRRDTDGYGRIWANHPAPWALDEFLGGRFGELCQESCLVLAGVPSLRGVDPVTIRRKVEEFLEMGFDYTRTANPQVLAQGLIEDMGRVLSPLAVGQEFNEVWEQVEESQRCGKVETGIPACDNGGKLECGWVINTEQVELEVREGKGPALTQLAGFVQDQPEQEVLNRVWGLEDELMVVMAVALGLVVQPASWDEIARDLNRNRCTISDWKKRGVRQLIEVGGTGEWNWGQWPNKLNCAVNGLRSDERSGAKTVRGDGKRGQVLALMRSPKWGEIFDQLTDFEREVAGQLGLRDELGRLIPIGALAANRGGLLDSTFFRALDTILAIGSGVKKRNTGSDGRALVRRRYPAPLMDIKGDWNLWGDWSRLSALQRELVSYVWNYAEEHGLSPTFEEVRHLLGVKTSNPEIYMKNMLAKMRSIIDDIKNEGQSI